jgi:hypothetical protein
MSVLTLMIIRHAEKPDRGWPGPGLTEKGEVDDKSLVIRGWHRAGAWCALFSRNLGGPDFPQPQVIYAANPNPQPPISDLDIEVSHRPFETVTPLGKKLGLKPVTTWSVGQEQDLVKEITILSGVVLVCWEHKRIISDMLPAIVSEAPVPDIPSKWDGSRFDVMLRFERAASGAPWSFRQCFPLLLDGDSERPLDF